MLRAEAVLSVQGEWSGVNRILPVAILLAAAVAGGAALVVTNPLGLLGPSSTVVGTETVASGAELVTVQQSDHGTTANVTRIRYTHDGTAYEATFVPRLRPALDWLRNNTAPDARVAAWWDYGHAIQGYTGREVVAATPSEWVWEHTTVRGSDGAAFDTGKEGALASQETMQDLATMVTGNLSMARQAMNAAGAEYLLLTTWEIGKFNAIERARTGSGAATLVLNQFACQRRGERCEVRQQGNVSYYTYQASSGQVLVPVIEQGGGAAIIDTPIIQSSQGQAAVRYVCGPQGVRQFQPPEDGAVLDGCLAFHPDYGPQQAVYVPPEAMDTAFVRLYLADGTGVDGFEAVYDGPVASIWRLQQP